MLKVLKKVIRSNVLYIGGTIMMTIFFLHAGYIDNFSWLGKMDHFSILSLSSLFGGFLFTELGIVISGLGLERIKRLNRYGFMDLYYRSIYVAIFFNIFTVVCAIILISLNESFFSKFLLFCEQVCLYIGGVLFIKCMAELAMIMKIIKKDF